MRRRRSSLRSRIALAFAVGGLVLSIAFAVVTYGLVDRHLVRQREALSVRQALVNAERVDASLPSSLAVPRLLATLVTPARSSAVLLHEGRWFATSIAVGRDTLPQALRALVIEERVPARQRFPVNGDPHLVVGYPLEDGESAYFEVFSLADVDNALRVLAASLTAGAGATAAAAAAVGIWAARRVLGPLARVGAAAAAISVGRMDTRLDAAGDAELATLAESFNRMVDALQERIERDARFASDVSHELRSPLTTLKTAMDVLERRRLELPPRAVAAVDLLSAEVARFERLVSDLLEISRYDTPSQNGERDEVRLAELVTRAVATTAPGVPVEIDPAADSATVRVDKRRMERVVANLLQNAETHGGGALRVTVGCVDGRARFGVEDGGPGVADEDRTRIFGRFARGAAAARRAGGDGVGLGLALVAEHVRYHDGSVWVERREGGGARFIVDLPLDAGTP